MDICSQPSTNDQIFTSLFGAVYLPIATKERRAEKEKAEEDKEERIYSLD